MPHKVQVNGTAYDVSGGRTLISGTGYDIVSGRTLVGATGYDIKFGVEIGTLPVGTTVYCDSIPHIIVQQGLPSSTIYDASCNGTWLLRTEILSTQRVWQSGNSEEGTPNFPSSYAHTSVSSTAGFTSGHWMLDIIKTVKIPYYKGTNRTTYTGANGQSTKGFLLAGVEVGFEPDTYLPQDGALLDYFIFGDDSSEANAKRIAYRSGNANKWWTRTSNKAGSSTIYEVDVDGAWTVDYFDESSGIRPAFIVPSETLVDSTTCEILA